MLFQSFKGRSRAARPVSAWAAVAVLATSTAPLQAADASWPTAVTARYKLYFAGFEVGSYNFSSSTKGDSYKTVGSAKVSALFGAFRWKGGITSDGTLQTATPRPANYKLQFNTGKKIRSVTLGFDKGAVKTVKLLPDKPPSPDAVPVKPEQLEGVYDPMSSILALTYAGKTDPCRRTVPIFDGKVRFNLVLSPNGSERIVETDGKPVNLKVCRVKYVPLAGHKPKDFVNPWVEYDGMSIALRPVPSANVYVPYKVNIPTTLGPAVMVADKVNITASNNARIALGH